jgi:hypothetical protein
LLGIAGAGAQTVQSQTSANPDAASQPGSVPTAQAPALPAGPAGPKIDIAEITARANRDVGVNIETAINGWQHELDRLESALQKPRLRYSELNDLRDELQRVRAGIEDFSKRLEPPLTAAKDQVALLGPAPAADIGESVRGSKFSGLGVSWAHAVAAMVKQAPAQDGGQTPQPAARPCRSMMPAKMPDWLKTASNWVCSPRC